MRKLGIAILIIAAVILVLALAVPPLVNINRYHDRIRSELQKRLARPVSLGQMHLSVLPLAIRVDNAVIGEDPAFHTGLPFAQAQGLDVRAKLWPLLRGDVEVESLTLRKPQIELVRNQQGVWNFRQPWPARCSASADCAAAALATGDACVTASAFQVDPGCHLGLEDHRRPDCAHRSSEAPAADGLRPYRPVRWRLCAEPGV